MTVIDMLAFRSSVWNRRLLAFTHDIVMAGLSFVLSMYLRLGNDLFTYNSGTALLYGLPIFVLIAAVTFRLVGMNSGIWRYASLRDLSAITRAVTATILLFLLCMFLVTRLEALPRSIPIINWFVLITLLGAPRLGYRLHKDKRLSGLWGSPSQKRIPVLLIGASDGAEMFVRAMHAQPGAPYRVIGVIDEKGGRVGRQIHGVKVLGTLDDLDIIMARLGRRGDRPQRLILTKTPTRVDSLIVKTMAEKAEQFNLTLARLPELTEFREDVTGGNLDLRPIAVEDLLGRPPIALDRGAIDALIGGRAVIVTGAGGTIGSELVRQIALNGPRRLVLADNGEFNLYSIEMEMRRTFPEVDCRPVICDVRDRKRVLRVFEQERPDLVFHAAALKHVPMVEMNPCEGILTNAIGTRNVSDAAIATGVAAMVLISTDKAVNPTNVMGASKRIAESYCQALDLHPTTGQSSKHGTGSEYGTRFMTVRFGNVLGSTGSVVPLFERQLRAGGPLTVTHPEIRRYFMTVREAVELVLQASAYGMRHRTDQDLGRIFVLDMGKPIRIADLARQMIRLAGLKPDEDIKIEYTGLRPGEKLFEELFDVAEPPERTGAEGVLVASPRSVDFAILRRSLDELEAVALSGDEKRVISLVRHIVPEFRHADHSSGPPATTAADHLAEVQDRP